MRTLILALMLILQSEVTIGSYKFTQVNHVKITKSWRQIGQTAMVRLPNLKKRLEEVISVGDKVVIKLGYEGVYFEEEYRGYVSKIHPNIPFEIGCEDGLYHAKRTNIKKLWKKAESPTLKSVVEYIANEINNTHGTNYSLHSDVPDVGFEKFRISNASAASALQKIKDEYGLTIYFQGNQLYAGLAYGVNNGSANYSTEWNVIKSDLTFRKAEDVRMKVKAVSFLKDNTKLETEVGDSDGEERTWHTYNVSSISELKKLANEKIQQLKYEGFEGSITSFLVPYALPDMVASLADPAYDGNRDGNYWIDEVITELGVSTGGRRTITLGVKV